MAHSSQNNSEPLYGSVAGSRGAVYYVTTDASGTISCTCPDFMSGRTARGTPVEKRVCKHLRMIFEGDLSAFTPAPKAGSALALADEIKAELATVEADLGKVKTTAGLMKQLDAFAKIKAKALAFTDKLQDQIAEISQRVEAAQKQAQEKL